MYTLPSPALFCLASKFGVELAACLLPRIQWRGLLSLGLTLRHMDCTPAHTQGPSLHRLYVIWLVPPGCATWWPFFILLSVFLFYLFIFWWLFFFFCFGLFTVDCVLQASNPTPLYLSPHLWLPLQLPAPSHPFLFITPDSCHFSHTSILLGKDWPAPKGCLSPWGVKVLISSLWVHAFHKESTSFIEGLPLHCHISCIRVWMGAEGFFLSLLCFVLVMMLFR